MTEVEPFSKRLTVDEHLMALWWEHNTLVSELEVWRYAFRRLGLRPIPEANSNDMTESFAKLKLRRIEDPERAEAYIKSLTEKEKNTILRIILLEKSQGIYYKVLTDAINKASRKVKKFTNAETYFTSFGYLEKRKRKLDVVMNEVQMRLESIKTGEPK